MPDVRSDPGKRERGIEPQWEITFTLAAGFDEGDAIDLYEYIEAHAAVSGAVLSGGSGRPIRGSA